jgi:hypothetical protein
MTEAIKAIAPDVNQVERAALEFFWDLVRRYKARPSAYFEFVGRMDEMMGNNGTAYVEGIRAITEDYFRGVAGRLAAIGIERHPNNERLRLMWNGLRPTEWQIAKSKRTDLPRDPNGEWIGQNMDQHWGQWVALRDGQLRGVAPTRKELVQILSGEPGRGTLITRLVL